MPNSQTNLESIDSRVQISETGVGDMEISRFDRPGASWAEDVHAQRSGRGEVHRRGARRNLAGGKQRPAAQLEIRGNATAAGEVPLQVQWVHPNAVSGP